jgi:hypothetical protein
MDKTNQKNSDYNFDLKKTIKLVFQRWKLLLPLLILGGALMGGYNYHQQSTTVSAVIYMDQEDLLQQLSSDKSKQAVADELGISFENLPSVEIQSDKTVPALVIITGSSRNLQENIKLVNTWAEVILEQAKIIQSSDAEGRIEVAYKAFTQANDDLVNFLVQENLTDLTYSQLEEMTGIDLVQSDKVVLQAESNLPILPVDKLLKLTQLLNARVNAENIYNEIFSDDQKILYRLDNISMKLSIVEQARTPKVELKSVLTNFVLGALAALIFAIIIILIVNWWKASTPEDELNRNTKQEDK